MKFDSPLASTLLRNPLDLLVSSDASVFLSALLRALFLTLLLSLYFRPSTVLAQSDTSEPAAASAIPEGIASASGEPLAEPKTKIGDLLQQYRSDKSKQSRGLFQFPLFGRNVGLCGSHHYNPDNPPGSDAYINMASACAFLGVLQEWRQKECKIRGGCTLSWGDISHKTMQRWNGHSTHTHGKCIDIRPIRKGGFQDQGLNISQKGAYDREKTKKLVQMLRKYGANLILFNDTSLGTQYSSGHDNHIHVCFPSSPEFRAKYCNRTIDRKMTCPEGAQVQSEALRERLEGI